MADSPERQENPQETPVADNGQTADAFNQRSSILSFLLTRRSARAADLVAPGPDADQLGQILSAAIRVPDHGKLAPWRFIVIDDRAAFADLIADAHTEEKGETRPGEQRAFQTFMARAPTLIVALSLPQEGRIPLIEQRFSMGAAIQNLLLAAGALGFGSNWVTGVAAYLEHLPAKLGFPGGHIAGFIFIGTRSQPLAGRKRPELGDIARHWPARA